MFWQVPKIAASLFSRFVDMLNVQTLTNCPACPQGASSPCSGDYVRPCYLHPWRVVFVSLAGRSLRMLGWSFHLSVGMDGPSRLHTRTLAPLAT